MENSHKIAADDYPSDSNVPERWVFVDTVKKNGTPIKDFEPPIFTSSAVGCKSNVNVASTRNKKETHTLRNNGRRGRLNSKSKGLMKMKKQNEFEKHNETECESALLDLSLVNQNEIGDATVLLQISAQTTDNTNNRSSRRLAGLKPELQNDFIFTRGLEYIIKDKPCL